MSQVVGPSGSRAHAGSYEFHDDDCLCARIGCNRDGHAWSCCGASSEISECTAPRLHPTSWRHPRHHETTIRAPGARPQYRSPEELRAIMPGEFDDA